jgi:hypothetical protein
MMLRKCFTCFALLLVLVSPGWAQSSTKNTADKDKLKKALTLIDETIQDAQTLKLPENRIRIPLNIAEMLWVQDETRARAALKTAIDSLKVFINNTDSTDPRAENDRQAVYALRQEIIQMISPRDVKLALDLVRATRPPFNPYAGQYGVLDPEAQLEIRLANQIAEQDPKEALRIAEEHLAKALDYEVMNLLSRLQNKDKALAVTLAGDIVKQLGVTDFTNNYSAYYIANNLLRMGLEGFRTASKLADQQTTEQSRQLLLDEQNLKALVEMVTKFMMNGQANGGVMLGEGIGFRSRNGQYMEMFRQLLPFMPEIERVAPLQAAAWRKRWSEYEKTDGAQNTQWSKFNELIQSGTLEAVLEAIPQSPPQMREQFYQQAAWKALSNNDMERAVQIINENITNPMIRRQALENLERQKLMNAGQQGKLEEFRKLLPKLSVEEQINLLLNYANTAMEKNDKTTALQLLDEAQGLIGERAENYNQLQAQLQLAHAFAAFDTEKSFATLESVVERLNELIAAAAVLNGFDIQYFRNGELPFNNGNQLWNLLQQCANELGTLGNKNFDRAKQIALHFQRTEARVMASLLLAKSVFNNVPVEDKSEHAN